MCGAKIWMVREGVQQSHKQQLKVLYSLMWGQLLQ